MLGLTERGSLARARARVAFSARAAVGVGRRARRYAQERVLAGREGFPERPPGGCRVGVPRSRGRVLRASNARGGGWHRARGAGGDVRGDDRRGPGSFREGRGHGPRGRPRAGWGRAGGRRGRRHLLLRHVRSGRAPREQALSRVRQVRGALRPPLRLAEQLRRRQELPLVPGARRARVGAGAVPDGRGRVPAALEPRREDRGERHPAFAVALPSGAAHAAGVRGVLDFPPLRVRVRGVPRRRPARVSLRPHSAGPHDAGLHPVAAGAGRGRAADARRGRMGQRREGRTVRVRRKGSVFSFAFFYRRQGCATRRRRGE